METKLYIVLSNVRRLKSKAWGKRNPNWVIVRDVFGVGSTTAVNHCRNNNIDPDAYEVKEMARVTK
jgi:hypothetical protein